MALALSALTIVFTCLTTTATHASPNAKILTQPSLKTFDLISTNICPPRVDQWSTIASALSSFITVTVPSLEPRAIAPLIQIPRKKTKDIDWAKAWWVQPASYGLVLFDVESLLVLICFWAKGWMDCRMNLTLPRRQRHPSPSPREADDFITYRQLQRSLWRAEQYAEADTIITIITINPSPPHPHAWTRFSYPSPEADASSIRAQASNSSSSSSRSEAPLPPTPQGWHRYGAHAREYEWWRRGQRERLQQRQSESQRPGSGPRPRHTLGPNPLPRRPPAQPRRRGLTPREMDVEEGRVFRQVGLGMGADLGNGADIEPMEQTETWAENRIRDGAQTPMRDGAETEPRLGPGPEPKADFETHVEPKSEAECPIGAKSVEAEIGECAQGTFTVFESAAGDVGFVDSEPVVPHGEHV
ncbi:hypothetical protein H2201_005044 [Coniosporium apollinis]|uniref:Uncharacterized protein n=1 Tax=Coniosporium apollinis TaxID=61459 RepID=A0ABQ9NW31_9PEZI|nr:hypothetical protein H2201_005044 [Coniosporium apollinis]